jgi:Methyltransferase domain
MWTEWTYHRPVFAHEPPPGASWGGHRRFGYDLVRNLRPDRIVELGVCWGTSFFTFCQAVKDASLQTELRGVDTWQGDENTGPLGREVFAQFEDVRQAHFSSQRIVVTRTSFDEARRSVAPASVDLLHIDGLHTYEAVRHDWETWSDAVADGGVVLFHDIAVREGGFGVHRLWAELKSASAWAEFDHSYGLGVLFRGASPPDLAPLREEWRGRYPG